MTEEVCDGQSAQWRGENKASLGELWVSMLRFYCVEFNVDKHVVCVRQRAILSRALKKWNSKKLAVEGLFHSVIV